MQRRLSALTVLFALFFLAILCRLIQLQVLEHRFLLERSLDQHTRFVTLAPDRGNIYDRKGRLLATSVPVESVYVNPRLVSQGTLFKLAQLLSLDGQYLMQKINRHRNTAFQWVRRKIPRYLAEALRRQNWQGVGLVPERKRVYPKGYLAAHALGFVGVDNQGLSGIELAFDSVLRGREGELLMESDPSGRAIFLDKLRFLSRPTDGVDLTLTLDETIQYEAERALDATLKKHAAKSGSILVMDVQTGELYALVSRPTFDPNSYQAYPPRHWFPLAISGVYEPGSTFKVMVMAAGLEEKMVRPSTMFYIPDKIKVGGRNIGNSHPIWGGVRNVSVTEILCQSLNTGMAQIGLKLGPPRLLKYFHRFGFGKPTGIELPGEAGGLVKSLPNWDAPDVGMVTFGQSIAVTPLQLITAFSAVANQGVLVEPHIVKRETSAEQDYEKHRVREEVRQVISLKTAKELLGMMEQVVISKTGTGKEGKLLGYRVAGKTGTAQKVAPNGKGYLSGHYIASFLGLVPASAPRLAILVVIDDPRGIYWGGYVAGPAFREVALTALHRLGVPPDKPFVVR